MVSKGQRLTFFVQGNISLALFGNSTAASVRQAAAAGLVQYFDDVQITMTVGGLIDSAVRMEWITSPYEARVSLVLRSDYGTSGDVGRVVQHAFWEAAGNAPTVSETQAAAIQRTSDTTTSTTSGISGAISSALQGIHGAIQQDAIILIVGVLALAYLVAGPGGRNVGSIARAARP
jgi:hypothetical protein